MSTANGQDTQVFYLACHCQKHVLCLSVPAKDPFPEGGVCDCSHCLKRRIIWGFSPGSDLEIVRGVGKDGAEDLTEYRFGSKGAGHQFCGTCGTHMLGMKYDPNAKEMMYNFRAIRDQHFDLSSIPLKLYSGIDRPPAYHAPTLDDVPGAAEYLATRAKDFDHPTQIYVGACHCQAIKFAVVTKPLEEVKKINDCGCSICCGVRTSASIAVFIDAEVIQNGVLWLYPGRQNISFHPSESKETPYTPQESLIYRHTFCSMRNYHYMCKTCGCEIMEYADRPEEDPRPTEGVSKEELEKREPWVPHNGWNGSCGLNIALLNGIGEYLHDAHGLKEVEEGKGTRKLPGINRTPEDRLEDPVYQLRL